MAPGLLPGVLEVVTMMTRSDRHRQRRDDHRDEDHRMMEVEVLVRGAAEVVVEDRLMTQAALTLRENPLNRREDRNLPHRMAARGAEAAEEEEVVILVIPTPSLTKRSAEAQWLSGRCTIRYKRSRCLIGQTYHRLLSG